MVDITKCASEDCLVKEKCYRYLAESGPYQSYANFKKPGVECEMFQEVHSKSELRRLDIQNADL